jgi:GntR family transcriptional regulator
VSSRFFWLSVALWRLDTADDGLLYRPVMPIDGSRPAKSLEAEMLDRTSFVPLYYQLQEVLKEQIESGVWKPGQAIHSEPELARRFGVSRVVVRQALAILEDDRQVVRLRGRGTFVAPPKIDARAGGLSRLLAAPRPPGLTIEVLDARRADVESSIRDRLGVADGERVLRLTTLLSHRGTPVAISYSFFRPDDVPWLEQVARAGRRLPPDLVTADHGIELAQSELSIESTQCGQFEADRFGIEHRSAVFLVLCTDYRKQPDGEARPFEVARVEYRGDLLQFRVEVSSEEPGRMAATWTLDHGAQGAGDMRPPAGEAS